MLFVNVDPLTFDSGKLTAVVTSAAQRFGIDMSRLVLEVTERSAFAEEGAAVSVFDELREKGIRFALDDHGSAYSHLSVINRIRPSFIKISATFGSAFEQDVTRQRVVRHIVNLAADFGCQTILEGIESETTARAAAGAGVRYGQGYHLGRPAPPDRWSESSERLRAA
jgi:EAL domain-containing protein (putative c-di-GMP-specific phosphodiesterase class I)